MNGVSALPGVPAQLKWIAGILVGIELALILADRGILLPSGLRNTVILYGGFWSPLLYGWRPVYELQPIVMFVSHAFLHGGLVHMAMNTVILLALGRFITDRYGAAAIWPLFLLSAIAGGAVYGLLNDEPIPMVGASGAVFGFLGLWIAADWRDRRRIGAPMQPVWARIAALVVANLVIWLGMGGGLAWEAHLGGFLVGLLLGLAPRGRQRR